MPSLMLDDVWEGEDEEPGTATSTDPTGVMGEAGLFLARQCQAVVGASERSFRVKVVAPGPMT